MGSFERFYDAQHARVLALVYALTGSWAVAEDLTQEAFTRALTRWEEVSGYDQPGAWVRTVAANLAARGVDGAAPNAVWRPLAASEGNVSLVADRSRLISIEVP